MLTYLNDHDLKAKCIADMAAHREAEQLVSGSGRYWGGGKGCAIGCLTHCDDARKVHALCKKKFGIPEWLARLVDVIFEGLSNEAEAALAWPDRFLRSLPVGVPLESLTPVQHRLAAWLLGPDSPSAEGNTNPLAAAAVSQVRTLHERAANGEKISESDWAAARSAVESVGSMESAAARSAVWSAVGSAGSAARSAWWSAVGSMESAARSAVWSAAWSVESAARSAAWSAAFARIADKTVELLAAVRCQESLSSIPR